VLVIACYISGRCALNIKLNKKIVSVFSGEYINVDLAFQKFDKLERERISGGYSIETIKLAIGLGCLTLYYFHLLIIIN